MQIIAIGGGAFDGVLENYILKKAQGKRVLFLPQASAEASLYIDNFHRIFTSLGATPTSLSLFGRVPRDYAKSFEQQDVIYVGGGNTRSMLALWREWGIPELLFQAASEGAILAGSSAGAICWFEQGITDSVWPLTTLPCLGLLPGSCCPHYDGEVERRPAFLEMLSSGQAQPGIALEEKTAAHYLDGKLHAVVSSRPDGRAFLVSAQEEFPLEAIKID
ncbi:MAG: peptidase E [Verrucomicrobia bacterium]|nr:peptidase E [Verrucomicrobiota bacterium]